MVGIEIGATAHRRRLCPKDAIERLSGGRFVGAQRDTREPPAIPVGKN
jgi:hypothetical protein